MNRFVSMFAALAALMTIGLAQPGLAEAADVKAGKKVFNKCKACHTLTGKNRVGPTLQGVFGRTAGTAKGFRFSKDMKAAGAKGLVWSEETLTEYLPPRKKGGLQTYVGSFIGKKKASTRMAFVGIRKDKDIANLIAYLKENAK